MSDGFSSFFSTSQEGNPDQPNSMQQGMLKGAGIGSMFGPMGTFVGGAIGGLIGGIGGNGARNRARRDATKMAYKFSRDAASYLGKGRAEVESVYKSKVSASRARLAGSGANLEGSAWESSQGALIRERDSAYGTLDREEQEFMNSASMEWFRKDYELMTEAFGGNEQTFKGDTEFRNYSMAVGTPKGVGRTGESVFTDAQRSNMRTYSGQGNMSMGGQKRFEEYAAMVSPGAIEFQRSLTGDDAAKAEYNTMIDKKIADANIWYDKQTAISKVVDNTKKYAGDPLVDEGGWGGGRHEN